eukprot:633725_1
MLRNPLIPLFYSPLYMTIPFFFISIILKYIAINVCVVPNHTFCNKRFQDVSKSCCVLISSIESHKMLFQITNNEKLMWIKIVIRTNIRLTQCIRLFQSE